MTEQDWLNKEINWKERDKFILLKRIYEAGYLSPVQYVCEGYHILKDTKHTFIDKRIDFDILKKNMERIEDTNIPINDRITGDSLYN
jgi:hypothetical protein